MDKQERNTEQQVWQRVCANRDLGPKNDLRQLRREAMELAAVYQNLSSRLMGRNQELAKRLSAGERANGAALAGIEKLFRTEGERLKLWQPGSEEPGKVLEKCYHRTRRCAAEYLARSADGECGVVFAQLAKRAEEHCAWIAEILGRLP